LSAALELSSLAAFDGDIEANERWVRRAAASRDEDTPKALQAALLSHQSRLALLQGRLDECERLAGEALALAEQAFVPGDPELLRYQDTLASYIEGRRPQEALRIYESILQATEGWGDAHARRNAALMGVSSIYSEMDQTALALPACSRAEQAARTPEDRVLAAFTCATIRLKRREYAEALSGIDTMLADLANALPENGPQASGLKAFRAYALLELGRFDEAKAEATSALAFVEQAPDSSTYGTMAAAERLNLGSFLARVRAATGGLRDARRQLAEIDAEALELIEPDHVFLAELSLHRARIERRLGNAKLAGDLASQGLGRCESASCGPFMTARLHIERARALWRLGRTRRSEAITLACETVATLAARPDEPHWNAELAELERWLERRAVSCP
jgi:tetratricopeptide (TPR) repeat protein